MEPTKLDLLEHIEMLDDMIQDLLDHCHKPGCKVCGAIVCPSGDEKHFSKKGCPSCAKCEAPVITVTFGPIVNGLN